MQGEAETHRAAVIISFGILAVTAAALTMALPEPTHQTLPETLDDGEKFARFVWRQPLSKMLLFNPQLFALQKKHKTAFI